MKVCFPKFIPLTHTSSINRNILQTNTFRKGSIYDRSAHDINRNSVFHDRVLFFEEALISIYKWTSIYIQLWVCKIEGKKQWTYRELIREDSFRSRPLIWKPFIWYPIFITLVFKPFHNLLARQVCNVDDAIDHCILHDLL